MTSPIILFPLLLQIICTGLIPSTLDSAEPENREMNIVFWNLENFFDYRDGGEGESDKEFSSFGGRRWSRKRFYAKCNAVAKAIFWMQDSFGQIPDVIGLAEIENSNVLFRLLQDTALRKTDYAFIHFDGPDPRGIDVALLYRKSRFRPVSVNRLQPSISEQNTIRKTRDILHVEMQEAGEDGRTFDFIVNHHPSKYGGQEQSRGKRMAAMSALKSLCDSLASERSQPRIVAMGDFNDSPDAEAFSLTEGVLVNMGKELHRKGQGSIRYEGKWDLIDMFLVSPELQEKSRMSIVRVPFLMVRDSSHPGEKPLRTYSGPRYIGGVSDHCPVSLCIF